MTFDLFSCRCRFKINFILKVAQLSSKHNHEAMFENIYKHPNLLLGTDVTDQVEIVTNDRGRQIVYLNQYKFVKANESSLVVHYRCNMYKQKCRARLVIDLETPIVKLLRWHNHTTICNDTNLYKQAVSIQKFIHQSDGSFAQEFYEILESIKS